jgi:hypothetical protein
MQKSWIPCTLKKKMQVDGVRTFNTKKLNIQIILGMIVRFGS